MNFTTALQQQGLCPVPDPVAASCLVGVCLFATKDVIGYIFTADK